VLFLKKIDPLKILHVVKLPIYSDRAHRDESNGLITGKKQHNSCCAVLPPNASIALLILPSSPVLAHKLEH